MWLVLGVIAVLSAGAQTPPPPTASADSASRGLYVALRVCAACHKVAYPGVGPDSAAPSFAVIRQRHDGADLRRLVEQISRTGHQAMPPIPMSRQEIEDVADYIGAVAPAPAATRPRPDGRESAPPDRRIALSTTHSAH
jgi:mono/diheme cytochrome c family protein